jgi:hypothetical protein
MKKIFAGNGYPKFSSEGLTTRQYPLIRWEEILGAEIVWRIGTPNLKLKTTRNDIVQPEIQLLGRPLKDIKDDIQKFCPVGHVFRSAIPDSIPERNYRLLLLRNLYGALFLFLFIMVIWGFYERYTRTPDPNTSIWIKQHTFPIVLGWYKFLNFIGIGP